MRLARVACFAVILLAPAVGSSAAAADGLPVLGIDVGNSGVTTTTDASQFVTMHAGGNTVVARVAKAGGHVIRSRLVQGTFTIPAVAYDGSPGGLAADARTLVLIEPRLSFPRADTTLLALDTRRLTPIRLVKLHGDFSFDAISPQGRWMYLIQYVSPNDATRYRVRAYDLRKGKLLAQAVVDPNARGEKMRGAPLSRATSADGRWAYTLYDGAGGTPFIHALDTTGGTARCIDLAALAGRNDLWRLRLRLDGATVAVRGPHGTVLTIDPQTFEVGAGARGFRLPLGTIVAVLLALLLAAGSVSFRRRDATLLPARSTLRGDG